MDYSKLFLLYFLTFKFVSSENLTYCAVCNNDNSCKRPDSTKNFNENDCKIETEQIGISFKNCELDQNNDLCYTNVGINNTVSRGCAVDKPLNGHVTVCQGNTCNLKCISDINCQQCNELVDPDCGKLPEKSDWIKKNCTEFTTNCYRCEDGDGKTTRGCGPSNAFLHCSYCYNNNCIPKKPPRVCYTCKSEHDPNCRNQQTNGYASKNCKDGIDHCIIEINNQGYTTRRCAETNEKCKDSSTCKICNGQNNCNSETFPQNRLKCYQCGIDDSGCENPAYSGTNIESLPCQIYKKHDACYTYLEQGLGKMVRGCVSDSDLNVKNCKDMAEKCLTCKTDSCNYFTHKSSKLMCMKCDSENNPNCILQQKQKQDEKNCDPIEYWNNEKCFTYSNGSKVIRGCISEVPNILCDASNSSCCNINGCNNKAILNFTCYKCRSDIEPECAYDNLTLTMITPKQCTNVNTNLGCYIETWQNNYDGLKQIVSRGCLSDKLEKTCMNKTTCIECADINCNNSKPPKISSAKKLTFNKLTILFCLLMVYKKIK